MRDLGDVVNNPGGEMLREERKEEAGPGQKR